MEYPKIETLYERDEKTHKLKPELILKNRVYAIIKEWQFTEKIDGTNIRIIWDGQRFSIAGRTDNAQLPPDLLNYLNEILKVDNFIATFGNSPAVIYGEGYGAGIQKGGDYSPTKKFIAFDVLIDGHWWMSWENTCGICAKLELDVVPFIGTMSLEQATEMIRGGFRSRLNDGKARAEGLVGRTVEALFDKKGSRLIIKLKTKDF